MFIIAYRFLDCVRLQEDSLAATTSNPVTHQVVPPQHEQPIGRQDSTYVEFVCRGGASRRVLRFDRADWARELLAEVSEAHFRFVQTAMALRRPQGTHEFPLRGAHPLALPFAPPPPPPSSDGDWKLDPGDEEM